MKTFTLKAKDIKKNWYLIDAENQVLGRLSTKIAQLIMGKEKPEFTPHLYMGDFVIVINAEKVRVTGKKETEKKYFRHSGYPGGVKYASFSELMKNDSDKVVLNAVKGMLPKNKLGNLIFKNLNVFSGNNHSHEGQKPISINIRS